MCISKCRVCGSKAQEFERGIVLNKYDIQYYRCPKCGFVFTEKPYWLDEAYSNAIADTDIGLLGRNGCLAHQLCITIKFLFPNAKRFLDYGAGYGVLVRLMRDYGYNFEWFDKYCDNIFAKGHECKNPKYDIVTAFELFEHLDDPQKNTKDIAKYGDIIVFSTETVKMTPPHLGDWWYYTLDTGQHVSIYTNKALDYLARQLSMKHYVIGKDLHVFSKNSISKWKCKVVYVLNRVEHKFFYTWRKNSLLQMDYKRLLSETKGKM